MGENLVKSMGENFAKRKCEEKDGWKSMGENFVKSMDENFAKSMGVKSMGEKLCGKYE